MNFLACSALVMFGLLAQAQITTPPTANIENGGRMEISVSNCSRGEYSTLDLQRTSVAGYVASATCKPFVCVYQEERSPYAKGTVWIIAVTPGKDVLFSETRLYKPDLEVNLEKYKIPGADVLALGIRGESARDQKLQEYFDQGICKQVHGWPKSQTFGSIPDLSRFGRR